MFVDSSEDEEWMEPINVETFQYVSPEINMPTGKPLESGDDNIYFLPIVERKESSPSVFPNKSFLNKVSRAAAPMPNLAQKSAMDTGCSPETIEALKNCLPSELDSIMEELKAPEEQEKLKKQMKKESIAIWDSASIYTGLGTDENGNYLGLSLTRLNDLLCNINQHLIIMRRDMIQHGIAIDDARQAKTLETLGFNNCDNLKQLKMICSSIKRSSNDLIHHTDKLYNKIEGSEEPLISGKYKMAAGFLLGASAIGIMVAYFYRRD